MKCESKYCDNELIEEKNWDQDWLNCDKGDKYCSRDFMGKSFVPTVTVWSGTK